MVYRVHKIFAFLQEVFNIKVFWMSFEMVPQNLFVVKISFHSILRLVTSLVQNEGFFDDATGIAAWNCYRHFVGEKREEENNGKQGTVQVGSTEFDSSWIKV